ncbi:MAG: nuclear transport factor 2 family protein [Pirellulales bacterium]
MSVVELSQRLAKPRVAYRTWGVLLAIGLLVAPLVAAGTELDDEADHEALRQLRALAERAINENRLELFEPYLDKDFWIVTYTDRQFSDFETFQARWQQTRDELLAGGSYTTKMIPERSLIFGDIAVTRGDSENVLINGSGEEFHFTSHWSAICRKVDGKWKVVQAHSSLSPFDNPMLRSAVKGMMIKSGAGCALVGLAAGWCVAAWWNRRRRSATPATDQAS